MSERATERTIRIKIGEGWPGPVVTAKSGQVIFVSARWNGKPQTITVDPEQVDALVEALKQARDVSSGVA